MKYLIRFNEAFANKTISSITNFLKTVDRDSALSLMAMLTNISNKTDIPLSNFKGEYMRAKKAISINSETDDIIKMWFSIKKGYITFSFNNKEKSIGDIIDLDEMNKEFIENNMISDRYLVRSEWNARYKYGIYESIKKADYALVINLSVLKKGLKNIQRNRSNNEPIPRIDDRHYRNINRRRWAEKMLDGSNIEEIYDMINFLTTSKSSGILDMMLDVYRKGDITKKSLFLAIKSMCENDPKYLYSKYKYR